MRLRLFSVLRRALCSYGCPPKADAWPAMEMRIMDTQIEVQDDRDDEYVAPVIVDYGTLVEMTASNAQNKLSDAPFGNPILGFSGPIRR